MNLCIKKHTQFCLLCIHIHLFYHVADSLFKKGQEGGGGKGTFNCFFFKIFLKKYFSLFPKKKSQRKSIFLR